MPAPDWTCPGCREQYAAAIVAVAGRCPVCREASAPLDERRLRGARVAAEPSTFFAAVEIPARFRAFTSRDDWSAHFRRDVPDRCGAAPWAGDQLFLWGPTGTGKTGLAVVLLLERGQLGDRCWFVSSAAFLERLQREFDEPHRRIFARATAVESLVIDDLFANRGPVDQRPTAWQVSVLGDLIAARWQAKLRTIITSNWSPGDLAKVAPSVASRLCEDSADVSFKGHEDRRLL